VSGSPSRRRAALPVVVCALLALACGGTDAPASGAGGAGEGPAAGTARGSEAPTFLDDETEVEMQSLSIASHGPAAAAECGLPEVEPVGGALVYFGCTPESGPVVRAVAARRIPESGPEAALSALLAGPTEEEQARGFLSSFGPETAGMGFRLGTRRGVAWVDFDRAILDVEGLFAVPMDTSQIVATLGQFEGIDRVLVMVGGEPLCKAKGDW
jgi:Sporulation and spore germination